MTDINVLFAAVAVLDIDAAVPWYERLFGRSPDIVVTDDEVMWKLADAAWLYVLGDPARAGHSLVTLSVADLDTTVAEIEGRGLSAGPIEVVGDAGRRSSFTDPDGNTLGFIEVAVARR